MIVFNIPHLIYRGDAGSFLCRACDWTGLPSEEVFAWAHEEAHEGHQVELPFEDPRVEAYIDWIASIEDGEIEAWREIEQGEEA